MIWKECFLQKKTGQIEDALGNLVDGKWKTVMATLCRATPWTDSQILVDTRDVTKNEQRFAIPIPFQMFPECSHAVIGGVRQKIKEVIELSPRYTVIQVEVYKK